MKSKRAIPIMWYNSTCLTLVLLLEGCSSVTWPVDVGDYRVGQNYGAYQSDGLTAFHNGIDAVGGGAMPPTRANLNGVGDGLAESSCVAYDRTPGVSDFDPATRELQPFFLRAGVGHAGYAHSVELDFGDNNYVVLWRHKRRTVGVGGPIDANALCIERRPGVAALTTAPGNDDFTISVGGVVVAIAVGPNGWCDTVPGADGQFVAPFYFRDGGGDAYQLADYSPDCENGGPNPRTQLIVNKGQRFAQISGYWGPLNYYHCHFMASEGDGNADGYSTMQNPLIPATIMGYSGGYDAQDAAPRIGPLFVKENDIEKSPAVVGARPVPHCEGQVDLSVETTDQMGGEDDGNGSAGAYNVVEGARWPNTAGAANNRWNGAIAIPLRVEMWIAGQGAGLNGRNVHDSSNPWFAEFRGRMNPASLNMDALWDGDHANNGAVRRYCFMPCNVIGSGYLENSGVTPAPAPVMQIDAAGRWNTMAGDTDASQIQWQTVGAERSTRDAEYPLTITDGTHPGWEFPDGLYRVNIRAKDTEHSTSDTWDLRIDNWAPRIIKLKVEWNPGYLSSYKTVYEYDWVAYAQNVVAGGNAPAYPAAADLIRTGLRGYLVGAGDELRVTIQYSESMDTSANWPAEGAGLPDPAEPYIKVSYAGANEHDIYSASSWSSTTYANDTWQRTYTVPAGVAGPSGAVGDILIKVRQRDMAHKVLTKTGAASDPNHDDNHLIDFKPRLEKVTLYQGITGGGTTPNVLAYRKQWKLQSDRTGLEEDASQAVNNWICYEKDKVRIECEFSDPMADSPSVELLKRNGAWGGLGNLTAGATFKIWGKNDMLDKAAMAANEYYGKAAYLRVTATDGRAPDANADNLDAGLGTGPKCTLSYPTPPAAPTATWIKYENEDGSSATTGGKDKNNSIKIETKAPEVQNKKPN